ncbi:MAG: hypothetical protein ABI556_15050 [Gemmatimonadales bacterium]
MFETRTVSKDRLFGQCTHYSVLAVTNIPEGQERPETPSKVIPMESDDYNMSDPIPVPVPAVFDIVDE